MANKFNNFNHQSGQAILVSVLFLTVISVIVISGLATPAIRGLNSANQFVSSRAAYYTAEAGVEDTIYRLKNNLDTPTSNTVSLNGGQATIEVTESGNDQLIEVAGVVSDLYRKISASVSAGAGANFYYGIQVGDGGLSMSNNARVIGNVFSNGSIVGNNGASVSGSAVVAGGIDTNPAVEWTTNNADYSFANASTNRDIGQSFIANETGTLPKVSVLLAKNGSPSSNLTVRIMTNSSGKPSNTTLASATIAPSLVGTTASWIDVAFSSPASLTNGTTYWLLLDYGSNSTSNYWKWRYDSGAGYTSGTGKYTGACCSGSPTWTDISSDLAFKVWIGGTNTSISNLTVGDSTSGSAQANSFSSVTVHGSSCPNQYCTVANPPREEMPISDGLIADWRAAAVAGGTCIQPLCDSSGNLNITNGASQTIGPLYIPGNLTLSNNATLNMTGVVYVDGTISLSNNCIVRLDSSLGNSSGVLLTDGQVTISNNCSFSGSGQSGSYILLLTDKNSPSNTVMDVSNNSAGVIYYAAKGRIHFSNNATAKEATAYGITMDNGAVVTYDSGLANLNFSSGPSGGWEINGWAETP